MNEVRLALGNYGIPNKLRGLLTAAANDRIGLPSRAMKIVVFGGSVTYGHGVEGGKDHSWPMQLERMFQNNGYNVSVTNAGSPGTFSRTQTAYVRRVAAAVPDADLVMFSYAANDESGIQMPAIYSSTYHMSASVEALLRIALDWPRAPATSTSDDALRGTAPVVMFYSDFGRWFNKYFFYSRTASFLGSRYGLPVLDARRAFNPAFPSVRKVYKSMFPDKLHPNAAGHALLACLAFEYFSLEHSLYSPSDTLTPEIPHFPEPLARAPNITTSNCRDLDAKLSSGPGEQIVGDPATWDAEVTSPPSLGKWEFVVEGKYHDKPGWLARRSLDAPIDHGPVFSFPLSITKANSHIRVAYLSTHGPEWGKVKLRITRLRGKNNELILEKGIDSVDLDATAEAERKGSKQLSVTSEVLFSLPGALAFAVHRTATVTVNIELVDREKFKLLEVAAVSCHTQAHSSS